MELSPEQHRHAKRHQMYKFNYQLHSNRLICDGNEYRLFFQEINEHFLFTRFRLLCNMANKNKRLHFWIVHHLHLDQLPCHISRSSCQRMTGVLLYEKNCTSCPQKLLTVLQFILCLVDILFHFHVMSVLFIC